jgi:hypothetical protein
MTITLWDGSARCQRSLVEFRAKASLAIRGMAKKNKTSSPDTPACQLATITPIALTVPQRF